MGLETFDVLVGSDFSNCGPQGDKHSKSSDLCANVRPIAHSTSSSSASSAESHPGASESENDAVFAKTEASDDEQDRSYLDMDEPCCTLRLGRSLTPQPKRRSWQTVMRERAMVRRSESADFASLSSDFSSPVILRPPRRTGGPASTRCLSVDCDDDIGRSGSEYSLSLRFEGVLPTGTLSAPSSPCRGSARRRFESDSEAVPTIPSSRRPDSIAFPVTISPVLARRTEKARSRTMPAPGSPLQRSSFMPFRSRAQRRSLN